MILFFDTETTGKYDFKADPGSAHQPHLVQLAAMVTTLEQQVVASLNVLVKPEGWIISPEVAGIHGIKQEFAERYGIPRRTVLAMFSNLAKLAQYSIAFNMEFDSNVLWTQFIREQVEARSFNATRLICAMKAATPVCKLPKAWRSPADPYKWPDLMQAHQHLLGCGFEGAHDAMVDVQALARVAFKLIEGGHIELYSP